jgi:hypothetical protein
MYVRKRESERVRVCVYASLCVCVCVCVCVCAYTHTACDDAPKLRVIARMRHKTSGPHKSQFRSSAWFKV